MFGRRGERDAPVRDAPVVYADRNDGLGGRISAIVNAVRLARVTGSRMRVVWPPDPNLEFGQAVPPASEVFDDEWRAEHVVDSKHVKGAVRIRDIERNLPAVEAALAERDAVIVPWVPLSRLYVEPQFVTPSRPDFDTIGFSPSWRAAIDAADRASLPEHAVALHVRAGDLIYGRYRRQFVHTAKAIPYVVAERVCEVATGAGAQVVVFGQGEDFLRTIGRVPGVTLAVDLLPGAFAPAQQAIAEIVLMSRAERIVARESVFAALASQLSGAPVSGTDAYLSIEDEVATTLARVPSAPWGHLGAAGAYFSAYVQSAGRIPLETSLELVKRAGAADPGNPLYPIVTADVLARMGADEEADATLAAALTRTYDGELGDVQTTLGLKFLTWFLLDDTFDSLERLAKEGRPTAAALWGQLIAAGVERRTPAPS